MAEINYPGVLDRIKAMVTDSIVIIFFMFFITYIFSNFESVPDYARIIAILFVFVLYDPLFTCVFGGTIGHMMLGIRVKKESNENQNISFLSAVIRFIGKVLLGVISFLTVSNNDKRKALHDKLVGSVVIYANKKN